MKTINYIILSSLLIVTSCNSQVGQEIKKTKEIVEQIEKDLKTEESRLEQASITNHSQIEETLLKQISSSENSALIKDADFIISICDSLISDLEISRILVEEAHGLTSEGELKNKMETVFVNDIFIKQKKGIYLKNQIEHSSEKLLEISSKHKLEITKENIPIKLNLFMEKNNQTWENYNFNQMPAMGVMPMLGKFQKDIILTKLMMLEKMALKSK